MNCQGCEIRIRRDSRNGRCSNCQVCRFCEQETKTDMRGFCARCVRVMRRT